MNHSKKILAVSLFAFCFATGGRATLGYAQPDEFAELGTDISDAGTATAPAADVAFDAAVDVVTVAAAVVASGGNKTAEDVADHPVSAVVDLVKSVRSGDWRDFAAIALSLLMLLLVKVRDRFKVFRGDRGGVILLFTLSTAGAIVSSLFANYPIDLKMFETAIKVGVSAIGGYTAFKKVVFPADKKSS